MKDISMFPMEQQELMRKKDQLSTMIKAILTEQIDQGHTQATPEVVEEINALTRESCKISKEIIDLQRPKCGHDPMWCAAAEVVLQKYNKWFEKYEQQAS